MTRRRSGKRLALAALALLIAIALGLGWVQRKTVTLVVDGAARSTPTWAWNASGLLAEAGVRVGAADVVSPALAQRLKAGDTVTVEHAVPVQIASDGQVLASLLTVERRPVRLLALAGVTLAAGDVLLADGVAVAGDQPLPRAEARRLQVQRAVSFMLYDGDSQQTLSSTAATLGQALWQAGIRLYAADRLSPPLDTPLSPGLKVTLRRSRPATILTQGQTIPLRTAAATVGEALAEAGLSPQGLDTSQPDPGSLLPADGRVRLVRVTEAILIEQAPLAFETEYVAVADLELDTQQLIQDGQYGLSARQVRVRYEDGQEMSRTLEAEWVAAAPQPRQMGYGTQVVQHTLQTSDGVISYYRVLQFWATSYAPMYAGGSITASGKPLRKGMVGVDRYYVPFGSQLYVPGYGYAEAADTGRIIGRWIDLGYSDDDYQAWHQWVTVYFLWPPPAYIPPIIPPPARY